MRLATRSNALGGLAGLIAALLGAWGKYRSWWWYDNVAHLVAGVSLGSLVAAEDSSLAQDLAIVLGIAVCWEGFECAREIRPWAGETSDDVAAEDTLLDTLLVMLGAAFGAREASR
jgi:hypothetical protein